MLEPLSKTASGPARDWLAQIESCLRGRSGTKSAGADELAIRCLNPGAHSNGDKRPSATWNIAKGTGHCHRCGEAWNCLQAAELLGLKLPKTKPRSEIVAEYGYTDEDGNLLYEVLRYEPKGFKQRRPDGDGWTWSTKGVRRVPYRLPELLASNPEDFVFIVEGEQDANGLHGIGLVSTTVAGGAGKWRAEYSDALAGKEVGIIPDNDEPGKAHGKAVAASLIGKAKTVKILDLPDLPPGGDVSDFIRGKDPDDAAERLAIMAYEAPEWTPVANEDESKKPTFALPVDEFLLEAFPDIDELIPGILASGAHTLATSPRGAGKSQLATAFAVSLAAGRSALPGFEVKRQTPCRYPDGEIPTRLVQERTNLHLETVKAEPHELTDHLHVISRVAVQMQTALRLPSLATVQGRDWLLRELDRFPARVVFIDTVRALMRHPNYSLNDEEGWRPCEELLAELSAAGVSVFYCHHDGKGGHQLGTSAREFDPSYVLHLTAPKRKGGGWCRFCIEETKGRLGPTFEPREYVLEPDAASSGSVWTIVEGQTQTKGERILQHRRQHPAVCSGRVGRAPKHRRHTANAPPRKIIA